MSEVSVSADVRAIVEMALKIGGNVDVTFEADGDVRISIYPIEVVNSKVEADGPKTDAERG